MSSGCVFRNLFKCDKKCDSVASRKALLQEFTSKAYQVEVVYVDNDGKTTEEQYGIVFQLSETQKDSEMITVHGNASMQFGEDTPITASWSGIYFENKNGYKMRLSGDNIEKDFYLYCDGNETINFLIKKTNPKLGRGQGLDYFGAGSGFMKEQNCSMMCQLNNSENCGRDKNCIDAISQKCDDECAKKY